MIPKKRIFVPGPTPVPEKSLLAQAQPLISHRDQDFEALFFSCHQLLQWLLDTKERVYIFPASGTGAMEAAIVNLFSPGAKLLAAVAGAFSLRWAQIASDHGCEVEKLEFAWGEAYEQEKILKKLEAGHYQGLLLTHNETATGVLHPVAEICQAVLDLKNPPLVLVDAISSLGSTPVEPEKWHCDVLVSASQKALMTPPGLSLLWLSPRARAQAEKKGASRHYFDVRAYDKTMESWQTPYTPAVSLFFALEASLKQIQAFGKERYWDHHLFLRDLFHQGCQGMGLSFLARDHFSPSLTALLLPQGMEVKEMKKRLSQEFGIDVAGGQGVLKGKIFRVAHMGYMDQLDIFSVLVALEQVVGDYQGEGVKKALAFLKT